MRIGNPFYNKVNNDNVSAFDPNENKDKNKKSKINKKNLFKKLLITFIILFFIISSSILFLLYGPFDGFRDWLITSAMTTMNHQYFAYWFYSDDTIQEVMSRNVVIESGENTNTDLIDITNISFTETKYANEYEKAVLQKDPTNNDYKIIDIKGDGYKGYLAVIYDPSRVKTVVTKNLNYSGQYLTTMAKNNNALVAINGGGFYDPGYNSTGGIPLGLTISSGKVCSSNNYTNAGVGGIIGFTEDNKLILGKYSLSEAKKLKIRDCVSFGPFLIVNGKPSFVVGNGGWGEAPRTAIGQRKDGIVLFLVIDGRRVGMPGADMGDLTEIMQNYGAYNAANLDGGTSSVMVVNGETINDPIDGSYKHQTRPIATGFILAKE